jgi:hypothetical protein
MQTDDRALFDVWIDAWKDLGHFEIIPVRTSAEAAQHIADKLERCVVSRIGNKTAHLMKASTL